MQGDDRNVLGAAPLAGVVLVAAHAAGVAPVGLAGVLLLAGSGGFAVERCVRRGEDLARVGRRAATIAFPTLLLATLGASLHARLVADTSLLALLRGSLTWLWLGFADVHAAVWSVPGAESGVIDPTLGAAAASALVRPAALWLLVRILVSRGPRTGQILAMAGLGACTLAAAATLPGADDARVLFAPELTTAAALVGVLVAAAGVPDHLLRAISVALPDTMPAPVVIVAALLWVPVAREVFGDAAPVVVLVGVIAVASALALATSYAAQLIVERVPREALVLWGPPIALLTLLVLWQATGAFTWSDPHPV